NSGRLFHEHELNHSYPHDWRGKSPVIFRATEQWFVDVDKPFRLPHEPNDWVPVSLRERAISAIGIDTNQPPLTEAQRTSIDAYEKGEHLEGLAQEESTETQGRFEPSQKMPRFSSSFDQQF